MCVSPLQYDSGMKSLARVSVATNLEAGNEDGTSNDELLSVAKTKDKVEAEFKVHRLKPGEIFESSAEDGTEGALRRRRGDDGGIQDVATEGSREVCREVKDPIKWFGILVPQYLRRSQQCFVQGMLYNVAACMLCVCILRVFLLAVDHCAELASAQMRVELARLQYQDLLRKKVKLSES